MTREGRFDDRDLDRLFSGLEPEDERLGPVAEFLRQAEGALEEAPGESLETHHLAAISEAHSQMQPSRPVLQRDRRTDPRTLRRTAMLSTLFASLGAKVATAALVAVTGTGALAATGNLPQPAQDAAANVAERVGVTIPSSEDEAGSETSETEVAETEGDETSDGTDGKRVDSDVREVTEDDTLEGREKGEKIADTADQNRQDGDRAPESPSTTGDDASQQGQSNNPTAGDDSNPPAGNGSSGDDAGSEEAEEGLSNNPTGYGRP